MTRDDDDAERWRADAECGVCFHPRSECDCHRRYEDDEEEDEGR